MLPDGRTLRSASRRALGRPPGDRPTGRLAEFRLEAGLPVWRFEAGGVTLEKRLLLPHLQNTVYVTYRLVKGGDAGGGPGVAAPAHAAAARALPLARRAGELAPSRPVSLHRLGRPLRDLAPGANPPAADDPGGRSPAFTLDAVRDDARSPSGWRPSAATSRRATCGAPASSTSS